MLIGFGLPIGVGLVGLIGWVTWQGVLRVKSLASVAVIGMMFPPLIHSMLEFPYAYAYFLVPILLLVGGEAKSYKKIETLVISRGVFLFQLVVLSIICFHIVFEYVLLEDEFRLARFDALRIGPRSEWSDRPKNSTLTQLAAMVKATRSEPVEGMTKEEIAELGYVALRFPSIGLQGRYVLALALNGYDADALRQLRILRIVYGEHMYRAILVRWPELRSYHERSSAGN